MCFAASPRVVDLFREWDADGDGDWQRIDQKDVTPAMRKKALRAHRIYTIKSSLAKKNRLVANGKRQSQDTYTDTTCPVASLLEKRIMAAVTTVRSYDTCTPARAGGA